MANPRRPMVTTENPAEFEEPAVGRISVYMSRQFAALVLYPIWYVVGFPTCVAIVLRVISFLVLIELKGMLSQSRGADWSRLDMVVRLWPAGLQRIKMIRQGRDMDYPGHASITVPWYVVLLELAAAAVFYLMPVLVILILIA